MLDIQPGYVKLVLGAGALDAKAALGKFAEVCRHESVSRGLILVKSPHAAIEALTDGLARAARHLVPGFRLAVVARGAGSAELARRAVAAWPRGRGVASGLSSELRAACWLIG